MITMCRKLEIWAWIRTGPVAARANSARVLAIDFISDLRTIRPSHSLAASGVGNPIASVQAEAMASIDLLSCLVSDELITCSGQLLERWRRQEQFRDLRENPRQLRLQLQSQDESQPGL